MPSAPHPTTPAMPPAGVVADPARADAARPLRRDAEANRRRILDAAGRLMAERGLTTPMEDIAAAAGVGIGTLYRRFPSRADLVAALFEDRLAAYVGDFERSFEIADGWEALLWCLQRSIGRQIADRALSELLEQDTAEVTVHRLIEQVSPLAERAVARARATGRLRADFTVGDLAMVQRMVVAVGTATSGVAPGLWRRYLDLVLDGMASARTEPTPSRWEAPTLAQLEALHAGGCA